MEQWAHSGRHRHNQLPVGVGRVSPTRRDFRQWSTVPYCHTTIARYDPDRLAFLPLFFENCFCIWFSDFNWHIYNVLTIFFWGPYKWLSISGFMLLWRGFEDLPHIGCNHIFKDFFSDPMPFSSAELGPSNRSGEPQRVTLFSDARVLARGNRALGTWDAGAPSRSSPPPPSSPTSSVRLSPLTDNQPIGFKILVFFLEFFFKACGSILTAARNSTPDRHIRGMGRVHFAVAVLDGFYTKKPPNQPPEAPLPMETIFELIGCRSMPWRGGRNPGGQGTWMDGWSTRGRSSRFPICPIGPCGPSFSS